jgi:putative CocE/NonD family hydrolase
MSQVADTVATEHFLLDKDVDVPMRDGARLKADVFRPKDGGRVPALLNFGPYQKDKPWTPPSNLEEQPNPWMNWETVNPEWWVPRGYASVRVDARGSGKSPGQYDPWSRAESVDFHDAIEWAAAQPWCNGNVGLSGISYYAINQWFAANQQPPSLKAMIPWEGFADIYRDALYHGGILSIFMTNWFTAHLLHHTLGRASQIHPDTWQKNTLHFWLTNNLDSGAFYGAQARWEDIKVPFLSVGNWTGMGLHLRGNTEAFMRSKSPHRKLRMQGGTHVHPYYSEEGRQDQLRFFDYWLKGVQNGVMDEPPVKLAIRKGNDKYDWRLENEWPLARTQWKKLYLRFDRAQGHDPADVEGALVDAVPAAQTQVSYPASGVTSAGVASGSSLSTTHGGGGRLGVSVETAPMTEDTEITGPLSMTLFVSSSSEDMDLMLTLRNVGPDGKDVPEVGQHGQPVPLTKGWLRASHRKLDPELSTPYRPYHPHDERRWLSPGEVVECNVEIWPTCIVLAKGHKLRVDIQPRDGIGSAPYTHYHADYNAGAENTIHAGGVYPSHILLPVIPKKAG